MLRQLPILLGGVIIFTISMIIAYRVSAHQFERVD